MFFSIVIPTYNSRQMLQRCLASIRKIDYSNFETIVVDDGSTDDTASMVGRFPDVKYIHQNNQGPAAARNRGVMEARGELILFTDADCVLPPDILKKYETYFTDAALAGVGGGYQTLNVESNVARYVGWEIAFRHANAALHETKSFGTYNAVFQKEALIAVDGFDVRFKTASGEDFDLCWRLLDNGYRLAFDPGIYVYHEHPDRIAKYLRQQYKRGISRTSNIFRHKKKAVSDNYVEKSVWWQPPLLAGMITGLLLLFFRPVIGIGCLVFSSGLLLLSNSSLYRYIAGNDAALLPLAILLSFLKPIVWSLGACRYFISRGKRS